MERVDELRGPSRGHAKAVPHFRQREQTRRAGLRHECVRRGRAAHLVGVPLQHHPRDGGGRERTKVVPDALFAPDRHEAARATERDANLDVRAEPQADGTGKSLWRRSGQRRVRQRGTGRVAHEDGALVRRQPRANLHRARQLLECPRRVGAAFRRLERLHECAHVDAGDERAHILQPVRHVHHPPVPPAVAGEEQDHVSRRQCRAIDGYLSERRHVPRLG